MSWSIDEVLEEMASNHIGIMDLGRSNSESGRGYSMQDEDRCSQI